MARRKKKGKSKQQGGGDAGSEPSDVDKSPHSFIFHRGLVGKNIKELIQDMRRLMEPYTASNLKVRKNNVLKDFLSVSGLLGVSHIVVYTKTDTGLNLKISRLPRGPTLTFRVNSYCLSKDVISSLKRHSMYSGQFKHHPLLVLNNFAREGLHIKLMATMFQNMFPSINVNRVKLNNIRRCVLFSLDPETNVIDFRHYSIKVVPVGMSRGVKKLIQTKIPNMGRYYDVSEYLLNPGYLSESEAEQDGPHNEVTLPQSLGSRGNISAQQSAVRLVEIGPRMSLKLIKIEEGLWNSEVIYHQFIKKTDEEIAKMLKKRRAREKLKEKRKKAQESNVERKKDDRRAHKEKSLAGIKKKEADEDSDVEGPTAAKDGSSSDDVDDAEWYRREVGEKPDPEFFPAQSLRPSLKRKLQSGRSNAPPKKAKKKKVPTATLR